MSGAPSISVIIPTLDRPRQTRDAVASAICQTLRPMEVIVVDDGSSEADRFDDLPVRVIRHSERRGAGTARNTGIDAATGEWVAFLDSDDLWLPHKLERQFERIGTLSSVLCCCNVLVLTPEEPTGRPYNRSLPSGDLSEWILVEGNTAQTSGLMLPTEAARRLRFTDGLSRHQDWDFVLRAASAGLTLSYNHEPLVVYDGFPRADRVSSRGTPADTLAWIDGSASVRALVSARARHEVLCRRATAAGLTVQPVTAIASLARAVLTGELRLAPTLGWLLRSVARRLGAPRS